MSGNGRIILGSRGSDLALAQVQLVEEALHAVSPEMCVGTRIIRTSGDEGTDAKIPRPEEQRAGRKGSFTAEIERRLLDGTVDVAVHSAKDLPSEMPAGLEVGGVLPRAPVEDILVAVRPGGLGMLPPDCCVGTSSVRRRHQLLRHCPGFRVLDLRGNVPTRLRKLREDAGCDAIVLARAGLARLGCQTDGGLLVFHDLKFHVEILSPELFLPAGGQGIIALQVRADDPHARAVAESVNHAETLLCLRAEREFLRLLQGDCDSPVGVLAQINGDVLTIRAEVFEMEARNPKSGTVTGFADEPEVLARKLMTQIYGG